MEAKNWTKRQHANGFSIVNGDFNSDDIVARGMSEERADLVIRVCNAHDYLVKALQLTLSGLENGSVKSKPILDFSDENAESLPMMSLASVIRAALAKAGA